MDLLKKIFKNTDLWFILIILFVSFLVRWYKIETLPYGIEGDEFSWSVTSYLNQFKIPSEQIGIWSMHDSMAKSFPISIIINKYSFLLFGQDILSTRKFLTLLSTISLVTYYLLCRKLFSKTVSLVITLLYSFSAYKLITSRIAVPHSYSDIFLYLAFLFLINGTMTSKKYKYLFLILSGSLFTLGLFIYNLAYITPLIGLGFIFFQFFLEKKSWKEIILIMFFFLLPIIIFLPQVIRSFNLERERKNYALEHVVFDYKKKQFRLPVLKENIVTVSNQLLKGLTYETKDMVVNYKSTLLPKSIVILALISLVLSIIKLKNYFLIFSWFTLPIVSFVLFGIFLPRMWIISAGSFFALSGISLSFLEMWLNKKNLSVIFKIIMVVFVSLYIKFNLNIFYTEALYNPSYLSKHREIVDLVKKHQRDDFTKTIYISSPEFNHGVIYPAVVFYFLSEHPNKASLIMKTKEEYFQIINKDEFKEKLKTEFNSMEYIIIDNSLINDIKVKDDLIKLDDRILEIKSHNNFTEISLIN